MDEGNDQWGVRDASCNKCWSDDGWQLNDSGLASVLTHEESLQMVNQLEHELLGKVQKFASGDWMNLFGPGSKETRCRIVIDLEQSTLIAAQEWTGLKFEDVLGNRLEGLADSVLGANEAHDNPADWGLEVSVAMPDWAGPVMAQGKVAESGFDDEIIVKLADGCTLRSGVDDPDAEGALTAGDYVRLCGPDGEEIHYWSKDEWQTDPSLVMGAIMIAAAGNRLQPSVAVEDSPSPGK